MFIEIGLTAFAVIAASIVLYFIIARMDAIANAINIITGIVTPFILGLVLAYLLCPLYNLVRNNSVKVRWPRFLKNKRDGDVAYMFFSKILATFVSLSAFLIVITGLLWMIIPQLFESIVSIVTYLPTGLESLIEWSQKMLKSAPEISVVVDSSINSIVADLTKWLEETVIENYNVVIEGISSGILGTFGWIIDIFVSVIICVFFLNSKEIFAAQIKKIIFAFLSKEKADDFLRGAVFTNKTFGGFINGKLLDSLIVGIICFVVMTIFDWPFIPLVSVIIGVTNIIPFFGPFIGAIPSTLLILMVDPLTAVYFMIFILILQQVDGNIIGPKILGNSTGISGFWVLFAILVGGGIFGFLGMIVGIPIFAVTYAYICFMINKRLKKKGLSVDLADYKYIYKEKIEAGKEKPTILEEDEKYKDILERTPIDKNTIDKDGQGKRAGKEKFAWMKKGKKNTKEISEADSNKGKESKEEKTKETLEKE